MKEASRGLFRRSSTLEKSVKKVEKFLERGASVGLVYIDLANACSIDDTSCWVSVNNLLKNAHLILQDWKKSELPHLQEIFTIGPLKGDDFAVFFVPKRSSHLIWTEGLLSGMAGGLRDKLFPKPEHTNGFHSNGNLDFYLGWSSIEPTQGVSVERLVYRAIREASELTTDQHFTEVSRLAKDLGNIIDNMQFKTVFQPVVHLKTRSVLGYEALVRGPVGSPFHDPEFIFSIAAKTRLLLKAEKLAKISAVRSSQNIPDNYKLFLNIESELFVRPDEILQMLRDAGCQPGRIVFEITERKAIKDFRYLQGVVKRLRDEGYQFAIDDVGSGYASMESIAILDPNFIKIDQSLIHDIVRDTVKQDIVRAFINLSQMRRASLIAEGVEEKEQFETLKKLGVEYAQGFFFSYPKFPPPLIAEWKITEA